MLLGAYGFAITQMNGCDLFTSVLTALVLAAIYGILLGIPTLKLGPDSGYGHAGGRRDHSHRGPFDVAPPGSPAVPPVSRRRTSPRTSRTSRRCPTAPRSSCCGPTTTTSRTRGGCASWYGCSWRSPCCCAGAGSTRRGAACSRAFARTRTRFARWASR